MHLSKDRKRSWIGKGLKKRTKENDSTRGRLESLHSKLRECTNQITERTTTESMEHSLNLYRKVRQGSTSGCTKRQTIKRGIVFILKR